MFDDGEKLALFRAYLVAQVKVRSKHVLQDMANVTSPDEVASLLAGAKVVFALEGFIRELDQLRQNPEDFVKRWNLKPEVE
jgi:hypothetical protein